MTFPIAFGIGFLGSFHCLGMCGPIALAVPFPARSKALHLLAVLLYNLGRIATYALMGLAFGLAGSHLHMAGFQRQLTIAVGILMCVWALASLFKIRIITDSFSGFWHLVSPTMGKLMQKKSLLVMPVLGMLNGFLPCGLVYMAIGGSLLTDSEVSGALFMVAFGLGTFPFMMAVPMLSRHITPAFRGRIRFFYPYIVLLLAGSFLLRGLNLGIPYVSPKIDVAGGMAPGCE